MIVAIKLLATFCAWWTVQVNLGYGFDAVFMTSIIHPRSHCALYWRLC